MLRLRAVHRTADLMLYVMYRFGFTLLTSKALSMLNIFAYRDKNYWVFKPLYAFKAEL